MRAYVLHVGSEFEGLLKFIKDQIEGASNKDMGCLR